MLFVILQRRQKLLLVVLSRPISEIKNLDFKD